MEALRSDHNYIGNTKLVRRTFQKNRVLYNGRELVTHMLTHVDAHNESKYSSTFSNTYSLSFLLTWKWNQAQSPKVGHPGKSFFTRSWKIWQQMEWKSLSYILEEAVYIITLRLIPKKQSEQFSGNSDKMIKENFLSISSHDRHQHWKHTLKCTKRMTALISLSKYLLWI